MEKNPGPGPGPDLNSGAQDDQVVDVDLHGHHDGQVLGNDNDRISTASGNVKTDLQVVTYNIRGLSDQKKVRHIINSCYKRSKSSVNSFFMFQETFVMRLDILKYLWRGEFHLTPGTGNSRGCLTLVTAPYKIVHVSDLENRAHVAVLTKSVPDKAELILVNVYAPNGNNDEKVRFFEDLIEKVRDAMTSYNCHKVILAGDLNVVFEENETKNRLYSAAESRIAASVKALFRTINLDDAWGLAPKKLFTWTSNRTGQQSYSTLDRVLFSENMFNLEDITTDWALSVSDHAAVIARINLCAEKLKNHSRISRLDPRLLLDEEGREHLNRRYNELKGQIPDGWDPHVRLEFIKMCIRTAANDAIGKVKAKIRDTETTLNEDINKVVDELSSTVDRDRKLLLMSKLDDLRQLKRNLVEKVGTKLAQKTARKWYNEGELSNKYFFNLLNRKSNDEIATLLDENGVEINDPKIIEGNIKSFYTNLYESVLPNLDDNDFFFRNLQQVSQADVDSLMAELTLDELTTTLSTCADSAPGPDGIPYSFLKYFWNDFGPALLDSWKFSLVTKELPPSHKVSYLRLIPKAGKDSRIISNLRPITLSNTDHKLVTKTYARKLTNIVASCIGEEQTAYIPGRLINDNVRSMLMTIDLANVDINVDGIVVSLDAKKAFDSVDHRYIRKCLKFFGLERFVKIFDVLYKGLKSDIIVNGGVVDGYRILKGVKQGDALSCVLFIICIEPLIRNIKANGNINSVESNLLRINIPKVYSFADDITVLAKNEARGLQAVFTEYEALTGASGLTLNAEKTEILRFGQPGVDIVYRVNYGGIDHDIRPRERIKVNGIFLLQNPAVREDINVAAALDSMGKLLQSWSVRRLTLLGRILIIKTFAVSKMIYLMQTLMLSEKSYKEFVKIVFKFLWNKNYNAARAPERIKREIMYTPVHLGGFGMMDIKALADSLDLRSYGRLLTTKHPFMSQIKEHLNLLNFFSTSFGVPVDLKAARSVTLLNSERLKILDWPREVLLKDANFCRVLGSHKLKELLTAAGKQSLAYFNIHRRAPNPRISDLTIREFQYIERFLKYRQLSNLISQLIVQPQVARLVQGSIESNEMFPLKSCQLVKLSTLSSKQIRLNMINEEQHLICIYKIGTILTPGEVLSWTSRLKKLTSTRHRNILLRVVHGDIFSNSRLARFGLRQEANCQNCQEPNETILHRIIECSVARAAWVELERVKVRLGLTNLTDMSIDNLIGAKDKTSKLELALQAELIHRLTSKGDAYHPKELVKMVVKFISYSERLDINQKAKFNEVLRNWNQ